ncbi:MAG TPA: hypothetical protein VGK74_25470 [Symbiobacteriaceae bacterium]
MITTLDHPHFEATPATTENVKTGTQLFHLTVARFGSLPLGYQPDEDDPAWPSRSGQAD